MKAEMHNYRSHGRPQPNSITKNQITAIHALWARVAADQEREIYLDFIRGVLGRKVRSSKELSSREAGRVIEELKRRGETGNRDRLSTDAETVTIALSAEQRWMIERLRIYLGWSVEGFEAFLKEKFGIGKAWALKPARANDVIPALLERAARRLIKSEKGKGHKVSRKEIKEAVPKVKDLLRRST